MNAFEVAAALSFEAQPWMAGADCTSVDPELWFPEKGGTTRYAKRVCAGCPVKLACLEFAMVNEERFGVWGGLSERERRRLARKVAA